MFKSTRLWCCLLVALLLLPVGSAQAEGSSDLMLILDASGSMWGQIEGENKIVIARRVLKELIGDHPDGAELGLVAYGHRREGDCDDIETLAALGPADKATLSERVDKLNPKGKTPITKAVKHAFGGLEGREGSTTVLLVSDGIETCGGDPCQAVRDAKAAGLEFVMHVVGFDVKEEDVSQLECVAQAGGGLYLDAENASELSDALDQAVAQVEIPDGRLSVKAVANGELADVSIRVVDTATGEEVAIGRTYTKAETNPRELPLPDGTFDVTIKAVRMEGDIQRSFSGIEIKDGSRVEKEVDFSTGELVIGVTRNGELGDATIRVYYAGTNQQVDISRTYTDAKTNPRTFTLTAGTYDAVIKSVEIQGGPTEKLTGLTVEGSGRVEMSHEFVSGTLRAGAVSGGELVDATLSVVNAAGKAVAQGRTYTNAKSNPKTFELEPGKYRLSYKALSIEGKPRKEVEVEVEQGETVEQMTDFGS